MKAVILLALAALVVPASAQANISGTAIAVDGDTLDMSGMRVRLFGIDAVEKDQTCDRGGQAWRCGADAHALLGELVAGKVIECEQRDTDVYGRIVGVCRAGRLDLSAVMAGAGFAIALSEFSDAYLQTVDGARSRGVGIWGSEFVEPVAWRRANPRDGVAARPAAPAGGRSRSVAVAPAAVAGVYYRNCAAARAAGAAPLYRGYPGYRPEMDGDHDGIACEPYYGRR